MQTLARTGLVSLVALIGIVALHGIARSHCEIPCGIYGDRTRIDILYEHITTVEKSMTKISELAAATDAPSVNQRTRWITNKEEHAKKIQHIVTQYFMTQRVKPKAGDDKDREKYVTQLTLLHEMLVYAMKSKQTVDKSHTKRLRQLVDGFAHAYFSAEDLEHIRKEHGKHHDG